MSSAQEPFVFELGEVLAYGLGRHIQLLGDALYLDAAVLA
jgi:hypothetical protein